MSEDATSRPGPRLWPVWLGLVAYASTLLWVWQLWEASSRQNRVMATLLASVVLVLFGLLWLLLLSRLRFRARLLGVAGVALLGFALSQAVEIREVSGDVVPILAWKWSPKADETLSRDLPSAPDAPPATPAPEAEAADVATVEPAPTDAAGSAPESGPEPTAADLPAPAASVPREPTADFPQFLGSGRNATVTGVALGRDWETQPPRELWRQPLGAGWAGFAIVGERAITLEQRGPEELVVCYDLETGRVLWSHSDTVRFESVIAGDGPRSTPTVVDGRVYVQGATGMLNVLDLTNGAVVWAKDILKDNGASVPEYGAAASPLVLGDHVVVVAHDAAEGSLVAYDRATGERVWNGGNDQGRYSSPALVTLAGQEQILLFYNGALRGHDPATGETLWEFAWPTATEETSQPVALPGDRVLLSSGYGVGSKLIEVARDAAGAWTATQLWESIAMKAKFTNVVFRDGHIYGLDDGILASVDAETGKRNWKRGRYGHGHLLLVDDLLVILSERGEVALVEARPDGYSELGRFQAIEGKTWNTPALAGAHLLIRNGTEAAAFRIPLADAPGADPALP